MKTSISLVVLGVLVGAGTAWSFQKAEARSHYTDALYGYSFDLPRFPAVGQGQNGLTTIFTAPAVNGFASNLTVIIQRRKTTRDAYRETSQAEYKAIGAKVLSERDVTISGREAYEVEFEGKQQDRDLHFLTLAVIDREQVALFTCTATATEFPKREAEFRACLKSVRLGDEPL